MGLSGETECILEEIWIAEVDLRYDKRSRYWNSLVANFETMWARSVEKPGMTGLNLEGAATVAADLIAAVQTVALPN